jgi:hypothetical protein
MAVLVHEMVPSTYSYVVHTVNPANKNSDEMMIEIVQGLGEALVSGSVEYRGAPHRFVYNKNNGRIRRVSYADKDWRVAVKDGRLLKELTDYSDDVFVNGDVTDLLRGLFKQAKEVEGLFIGEPQDIEGCLVNESANRISSVFVQSRNQQGVGDSAMLVGSASMDNPQFVGNIFALQKPDRTGGIDFNPDKMTLQVQNTGGDIKFHIDPAMIQQLQDASGLTPVIIDIQPMTMTVPMFLGLKDNAPVSQMSMR